MPPDTSPMNDREWSEFAAAVGTLSRYQHRLPGRLPRFVAEALKTLDYGLRESMKTDEQLDRYTLVGCPYCDAPPDHYCVTNTGNVYDDANGIPYFHAGRRRAVDELDEALS